MTTAIKRRRGTTSQHSTFTGLEGEITVDTTKETLVVHDGATAGGHPLAKENNPTFTGNATFSGGTANGVAYLNGSKVLTTGSALTFDGSEVFKNSGGTIQYNDIRGSAAAGTRLSAGGTLGTDSFDVFQNSSAGYVFNRANTPVIFGVNNAEQMRLTSTGLGIGTSSASSKLHVDAGSLAPTSGSIARFDTSATTAYSSGGFVGGQLRLNYGNATSSYGGINFSNFGATSQEFFGVVQNSSGYGNFVWQGFNGSYGERMRLDSSGNLLVGTTSGTQKLVVSGVVGEYAQRITAPSTSGTYYFEVFYAGASGVGSITSDGTSTTYATSSDYRLKNITGPITTSGAYIDSLNPVEGTWKADGSTFVGLIAHEVQEASRTQVATGEKDGEQMQGMDYSSAEIIANLIAELQSVRKRLAALEAA